MDVPHIIAGRFRIECEIGKGGMGTVYRATHLGLERPVAVKIIKQEFAFDPDVSDRFMREARTMARLRHTHAAMIFDAGSLPDGRHFIVMEFVEGETLCDTLSRESPFEASRAVRIASEICNVLAEAHSLGIVHRDLKPSNIMLNERGVCVLDFGVAKVLATSTDATATHATTGSGIIVGTPRYMSPEQCLGQRIGARSDLYSLGVLLYEMLTGHPPFTDPLPSAVLVKQATAPPPPLSSIRRDLPSALVTAVHALLAKQPQHRPASANAAKALLERSILKPVRPVNESEPFAGMVAMNQSQPYSPMGAAAPFAILGILFAVLFIWGGLGSLLSRTGVPVEAASLSAVDRNATTAKTAFAGTEKVSAEAARKLVDAVSQGPVQDVRMVRGKARDQIVALNRVKESGATYMFALEKRGSRFMVVKREALDLSDFRSADWKVEQLDLDGDGYDEVIYTGRNAKEKTGAVRTVTYVPRKREAFALRVQPDGTNGGIRMKISDNLKGRSMNFLRRVLEERAREAYGKK